MLNKLLITLLLTLCFSPVYAEKTNPSYDAKLAAKYGGDEYGMKNFVW